MNRLEELTGMIQSLKERCDSTEIPYPEIIYIDYENYFHIIQDHYKKKSPVQIEKEEPLKIDKIEGVKIDVIVASQDHKKAIIAKYLGEK